MATRHGHLAPLLAKLHDRSGMTLRQHAEKAGVGLTTLHKRLHAPGGMGPEVTVAVARAAGASSEELARVKLLDALDRGAVPIPPGADEGRVARALAVLEGAA